jgi:regulator of cell morphogenesis and NO signaling
MPTITETVREIALNQPSSIRVFEQFGIDYCCGGRKPLAIACTEQDVEIGALLTALANAASESRPELTNWGKASLENLAGHIVSQHHEYAKKELPRLDTLAQKVVAAHESQHGEVVAIQSALQALDQELTQHLLKEEQILFPYIAQLEVALASGSARPHGCFGTVENPIAMMMQEHDGAGQLLAEIRELSSNFIPPQGACPTYHAFYAGLKEFEQDLHQHIHLENNILFPRAIEMETSSSR